MNNVAAKTEREFRRLIFRPLFADKTLLFYILLSLTILSVAQMLLIALMGPFVKVPLSMGGTASSMTFADLFPPGVIKLVHIDPNVSVEFTKLAIVIPLMLVAAQICKAFASFLFDYYRRKLTIHVAHHMRSEFFEAIIGSKYSHIITRSPAEWMSVVMNDVFFLEMRLSDILSSFVKDGALIVSSFVALALISPLTAIILLVIAPFAVIVLGWLKRKIESFAKTYQMKYALLTRSIYDLRQRFNFIRAQKGEETTLRWYKDMDHSYYRSVRKAIAAQSILSPGLEFLGFLIFAVVIYLYANGFMVGRLDSGSVVQFFAALLLMFRPLKNLGLQLAQYGETRGAVEGALQLYSSLKSQLDESARVDAVAVLDKPLNIEICSTHYPDRDITVEVREVHLKPGQAVAIIGPSGGGKSSFLKTVAGLLEPKEWKANFSSTAVASMTSMVSQFPFLFNDTLRSNLSYGAEDDAQVTDLENALGVVGFDLSQKNLTLDEALGPGLRNVSGGQKQLLTIARGILRGKPIWLLDEPSSALDPKVEALVLKNLLELRRSANNAMLVVTHRLAHLSLFDEVWFFEGGKLTMKGSHSELFRTEESYRRFCKPDVNLDGWPQATDVKLDGGGQS